MNIKILYDNNAQKGFISGWGISLLINDTTLFDTGAIAADLISNMHTLKVDPANIDRIIISHDDWDHIGGIPVIKYCGNVDVYLPADASSVLKKDIKQFNPDANIVEVSDAVDIGSNMTVTKMLGDNKKEISLAVVIDNELVVVTGCAHPGLDVIMAEIQCPERIHAVVGGFHDFRKLDYLADVDRIFPCHCTTMRNELADKYPDKVELSKVGQEIAIGGSDDVEN